MITHNIALIIGWIQVVTFKFCLFAIRGVTSRWRSFLTIIWRVLVSVKAGGLRKLGLAAVYVFFLVVIFWAVCCANRGSRGCKKRCYVAHVLNYCMLKHSWRNVLFVGREKSSWASLSVFRVVLMNFFLDLVFQSLFVFQVVEETCYVRPSSTRAIWCPFVWVSSLIWCAGRVRAVSVVQGQLEDLMWGARYFPWACLSKETRV